jgi:hypothetical protein
VATLAQRVRLDLAPGGRRVEMEPLITLRPKGGIAMRVRRRDRAAVTARGAAGHGDPASGLEAGSSAL